MSCLAAATFALALAPVASAVTYFVSPDGDDGGTGLGSDDPRRTIKPALSRLAAGDTLYVMDGTYDFFNQGSENLVALEPPSDHIVLAAFPGATSTIDWAGASLTGVDPFLEGSSPVVGVTVRGLRFRNWETGAAFIVNENIDSLTIESCEFENISPAGSQPIFYAGSVRGGSITGCTFVGRSSASLFYAIYLWGDATDATEGFLIENCVFNSPADLVHPLGWSAGIAAVRMDGVTIRDCFGYNAGHDHDADGQAESFINLLDADDVIIEDVEFRRYLRDATQSSVVHDADGIKVHSLGDDPSERVTVERCALWGAGHGVNVGNARDVTLQHVWCDSTYDDCVFFDDTAESASASFIVSHFSQDNGIDVQGTNIDVRHCTIVRPMNHAFNVMEDAAGVTVSDCIVYDARDPSPWFDVITHVAPGAAGWSFDHDVWFDPDGVQTSFRFDGSTACFTDWQRAGHDVNGAFEDPLFCDAAGRAWPIYSGAFRPAHGSFAAVAGSDGMAIGALGPGCGLVAVPGASGGGVLRAYPNPVRTGGVGLRLATSAGGVLRAFDASGRCVMSRTVRAGRRSLRWDVKDVRGDRLPPGVYVLRLERGQVRDTERLVIVD